MLPASNTILSVITVHAVEVWQLLPFTVAKAAFDLSKKSGVGGYFGLKGRTRGVLGHRSRESSSHQLRGLGSTPVGSGANPRSLRAFGAFYC